MWPFDPQVGCHDSNQFERSLNYPKKVRKDCQDPILSLQPHSKVIRLSEMIPTHKKRLLRIQIFCTDFWPDDFQQVDFCETQLTFFFGGDATTMVLAHGFCAAFWSDIRFSQVNGRLASFGVDTQLGWESLKWVDKKRLSIQYVYIYMLIYIYIYMYSAHILLYIYMYRYFFLKTPFECHSTRNAFLSWNNCGIFEIRSFPDSLWPLMVPWERCNVQLLSSMNVNIIWMFPKIVVPPNHPF